MNNASRTARLAAAGRQSAVFLLPAYKTPTERADSMLASAELVRQAIEPAVRAGRDDVAFELLDLAYRIEAGR